MVYAGLLKRSSLVLKHSFGGTVFRLLDSFARLSYSPAKQNLSFSMHQRRSVLKLVQSSSSYKNEKKTSIE
jgi:hypothetical protein